MPIDRAPRDPQPSLVADHDAKAIPAAELPALLSLASDCEGVGSHPSFAATLDKSATVGAVPDAEPSGSQQPTSSFLQFLNALPPLSPVLDVAPRLGVLEPDTSDNTSVSRSCVTAEMSAVSSSSSAAAAACACRPHVDNAMSDSSELRDRKKRTTVG